ncbi:unnamed protein product [Cutaneotrichosporon oleaginosum]
MRLLPLASRALPPGLVSRPEMKGGCGCHPRCTLSSSTDLTLTYYPPTCPRSFPPARLSSSARVDVRQALPSANKRPCTGHGDPGTARRKPYARSPAPQAWASRKARRASKEQVPPRCLKRSTSRGQRCEGIDPHVANA